MTVIVLMGVSGSGKTTIGELLSRQVALPFIDGDDHHPPANVEKMRAGTPLTDDDRRPWLEHLHRLIADHAARGEDVILACSALRATYRKHLSAGLNDVKFVLLNAPKSVIAGRLAERRHRFMPSSLLDSQFDTLETPDDASTVSVEGTPDETVRQIRMKIGL